MRRFPLLLCMCAALAALGTVDAMSENNPTHDFPPLRHGLKAVFGNHGNDHGGDYANRIPRMIKQFQELDVHLTRIELRWVVVEAERGVYDWSEYDRLIGALHENGIEPMLMFYAPPLWTMEGPPEDEDLFIRLGMENLYTVVWPEDQYKDDLRRFAQAAAERYQGKARLFEFWNEPDGMGAPIVQRGQDGKAYTIRFGGDPVRYTEWLKVFYEGVKAGNPDAVVAAGSLCEPFTYSLEAMYGAGGRDYFDAVTCHPYGETINIDFIESLREVMVRYGDWRKPIWVTEFGWTTGGDSVDPIHPKMTTGMRKQAESIPPMFEAVQELPYVTQFYYFTLNDWGGDNGFGLVDLALEKKPSFEVYKRVVAESPDDPRTVEAPGVLARAPVKPVQDDAATIELVQERGAREVVLDITRRPIFPAGETTELKPVTVTAAEGVTPVEVPVGAETPGVYAFELRVDGQKTDEIVYARPLTASRVPQGQAEVRAPGQTWQGEVLSELQFAWDEEHLHVTCLVDHGETEASEWPEATPDGHGEQLWNANSIQLAIDPLRDAIKGAYPRPDDSEFIVARTRNRGPQVRCTEAMEGGYVGPFEPGLLSIQDAGGRTRYQVSLPWKQIHPGTPKPGDVIGVAVLVNNIEDGERKVYEWGGGIAHKKLPVLYGAVVLEE